MKPMLAATVKDTDKRLYPLLASPKLDGIRAIVKDGQVLSRSLKVIPNNAVQHMFGSNPHLNNLDGELIAGKPTAPDVYNYTQSRVMTKDAGSTDIFFYVFDCVSGDGYSIRYQLATMQVREATLYNPYVQVILVPQVTIYNSEELLEYEKWCLAEGYEGVILRKPEGAYKYGRSTLKEEYLLKLKRFEDSEARILGMTELMKNNNEATVNELGYQHRSSHQGNKVGMNMLGALRVQDIHTGIEFEIGTGFSKQQRTELWCAHGQELYGKLVKYKYLPTGVKEKPRHPVFLGFRDERDMPCPE